MESFSERLAGELRAELSRQRRTVSQMAIDLGIPKSTLTRRLAGMRPLDTDQLDAIAAWLDVSVTELCHRADPVAVA